MKVRVTITAQIEVAEDEVLALRKLEPSEMALRILEQGEEVKSTVTVKGEK